MGTFYQFPPGGGTAAALPTAGISQLFGRSRATPQYVGRLANITVVVTSGTATFQYWDENDTPSSAIAITAGLGYHDMNRVVQRFSLTGAASVAMQLNDPPADIDVKTLLAVVTATVSGTVTVSSVTNPVSTDIGQQVGGAIDPRQIRTLTTADAVSSTIAADSVGLAKSGQLPAALDSSGGLKTAVIGPLSSAGSVRVHDVGA